jgi:hypothetical protein
MRKNSNAIWIIKNNDGYGVTKFRDVVEVGINHFQNSYKEPLRVNVAKVVKLFAYFPRFVDHEHN